MVIRKVGGTNMRGTRGFNQSRLENIERARLANLQDTSAKAAEHSVKFKKSLPQLIQAAKAVQGKTAILPDGREGKVTDLDYGTGAVWVRVQRAPEQKYKLETLKIKD